MGGQVFFYYLSNGRWVLLAGIIGSLPVLPYIRKRLASPRSQAAMDISRTVFTALVFALSLLACVKSTYNPFIYFNF